jgi:hypothetical protein
MLSPLKKGVQAVEKPKQKFQPAELIDLRAKSASLREI